MLRVGRCSFGTAWTIRHVAFLLMLTNSGFHTHTHIDAVIAGNFPAGHVALQRRPTAAFIRKGPCLTLTPHAAPPTDADINTITDTTNFQSEQQRQDSSSPCPFLASLPRPPSVSTVPWYKRLKELLDPREFQQLVVKGAGGSQVVQVPKQMAFDEAVIPLSADLVKEVMNGESNGTVKQTTIPSLCERLYRMLCSVQSPHVLHDFVK